MKHNDDGAEAEKRVCKYLEKNGYKVIDRNWKTRTCEIDVIALKDDVMHFVEVKYRSNNKQGTGLDYITRSKLAKMSYAAELWTMKNNWLGGCELSVAEVVGSDFGINYLENIN
jgi:uncharacterized protein (TIGR00252 family)